MTVKTLTVSGLNVAAQVLGGTGLTSSTTNGVTTLSVSGTQASGTIFLNPTATSYSELYVDSNDRRVTLGQRSSTNAGGDLAYLYTATATPMSFWTSATERVRITSAGNVGIGTTSPASGTLLHVSGVTANDITGHLQVENTYSSTTNVLANASITVKSRFGTSHFMQWENLGLRIGSRITTNSGTGAVNFTYGNDVVGMVLNSSGYVGIGTSTPGSTLHVAGSQSVKVSLALATATTLDATHYIITTPATGNIGYTLPSAATAANRVYMIKRLTTGTVIITPASGDSIETGAANATFSIPAQYDSYTFVSDGTSKWYII